MTDSTTKMFGLDTNPYFKVFKSPVVCRWSKDQLREVVNFVATSIAGPCALLFGSGAYRELLPFLSSQCYRTFPAPTHSALQNGWVMTYATDHQTNVPIFVDAFLHPEDQFVPKDDICLLLLDQVNAYQLQKQMREKEASC